MSGPTGLHRDFEEFIRAVLKKNGGCFINYEFQVQRSPGNEATYIAIESLEFPMWFSSVTINYSNLLAMRNTKQCVHYVLVAVNDAIQSLEGAIRENEMSPFRQAVRKTQREQNRPVMVTFPESLRSRRI